MKKTLLLIITVILALLLILVGCNSESTDDGKNENNDVTTKPSSPDVTTESNVLGVTTVPNDSVEKPDDNKPNGPSEGLEFKSNENGTCAVIGIGLCADTYLVVPEKSPEGEIVIRIESNAFDSCTNLTSVTIPDSVRSIGNVAFANCSNLTSVFIGSGVQTIGTQSFENCTSLTNVNFSQGMLSIIGYGAFKNCCKLTTITIPDGTEVKKSAFANCLNLVSVTFGNEVKLPSSSIFAGCIKLAEIINLSSSEVPFYENVLEIHSEDSKIVNKDGYLFYTYDGVNYLLNYIGDETILNLPENYNGENYVIRSYAFYCHDNLTSVTIPNSVTTIDDHAFYGCERLISVIISEGVTHIGYNAFKLCKKLADISIPKSIITIGSLALNGCNLININYNGTKHEWEIISKGYGWDPYAPSCVIHCTDGDIPLTN